MSLLCVPIEQVSELEERTQGMTAWSPPSPSISKIITTPPHYQTF